MYTRSERGGGEITLDFALGWAEPSTAASLAAGFDLHPHRNEASRNRFARLNRPSAAANTRGTSTLIRNLMSPRHAASRTRLHNRNRKSLQLELLEPRHLMAGDTWLINFQIDEATPVTRYLPDIGAVYGARGGGLSYGWSTNHDDVSRERSINADQRLDTLIHFKAGASWEFGLPNGMYEVTASIGDPQVDSTHTMNVEGVNYWNALPLAANAFGTKTMTVTVADGRLTLNQGAAANLATRINYMHIVGLPSGPNGSPAAPTITEPATEGQVVSPADVHMEVDRLLRSRGQRPQVDRLGNLDDRPRRAAGVANARHRGRGEKPHPHGRRHLHQFPRRRE